MTSKPFDLISLKFVSGANYHDNLQTLITLIKETPKDAFIVAPEVCFTNFDYDHFEEAAAFSEVARKALFEVLEERSLIVTMIEKEAEGFYNFAQLLYKGQVVHKQAKAMLFKFGGEHEYFSAGSPEAIILFEHRGFKIGILICFELRFKKLWQQLEGADIIAIPSQWGKLRASHFEVLTEALALVNECYIVASDSANEEMGGRGGIIHPDGSALRNNEQQILSAAFDPKAIKTMRRYLDIGIPHR